MYGGPHGRYSGVGRYCRLCMIRNYRTADNRLASLVCPRFSFSAAAPSSRARSCPPDLSPPAPSLTRYSSSCHAHFRPFNSSFPISNRGAFIGLRGNLSACTCQLPLLSSTYCIQYLSGAFLPLTLALDSSTALINLIPSTSLLGHRPSFLPLLQSPHKLNTNKYTVRSQVEARINS